TLQHRDLLYVDRELSAEECGDLGLDAAGARPDFFERFAAHLAATEVMIPPSSSARGHTVDELALRQRRGLVVLGVRHRSTSRAAEDAT
ncbi:TrkA C-terminal domain-containing protein, partial [Streptomyces scabiei]|uniref:TrkA C-terminal domain-containing protein n=1 Tax=Streptomyces scabiei TaxID=1930 RepID=UPI0038F6DC87